MLFFHSPHHHAEVLGFDDDADTLGLQDGFQCIADFLPHPFLDLEPSSEHIDDPRDFAEADDVLMRDVPHMDLAEEGEQVMLAEAEEFDIFDDHHTLRVDGVQSLVYDGLQILLVARSEVLIGRGGALGSSSESGTVGIFSQGLEEFLEEFFHG